MRQMQGPRDLPWARRALVAGYDPASISDVPDELRRRMTAVAEHFCDWAALAELYWVTKPMTELALDAALDIPDWTMATARPSPSGLLVWGGSVLPAVPVLEEGQAQLAKAQDGDWTIRPLGVMWMPAQDSTSDVQVVLLGPGKPMGSSSPLLPVWTCTVPLWGSPVAYEDMPEATGVLALLGASWHLMMEPKVALQKPLAQPRKDAVAATRDGVSSSDITVVDLRAIRHVDAAPGESSGRHLTVRHYVRGHWRRQWKPSSATHEPRFIAPYIKGPSSAPLKVTDRVMVWRR